MRLMCLSFPRAVLQLVITLELVNSVYLKISLYESFHVYLLLNVRTCMYITFCICELT